jgi:hypothetical protein
VCIAIGTGLIIKKLDNHNVNLCCTECSLPVAKLGSCTGGSRHVNPQGDWFEIGVFSKASGVGAAGKAYAEHNDIHGSMVMCAVLPTVATVIVNWAGNMNLQRLVAPFLV